jgi:hypothetical protein
MSRTILPSGEELQVTPEEILRYLNPDGLRQLLRQERLRWNLKPNKDADYYDNQLLFKFSGELHNAGMYQRMELRTFPDNGAYPGYAGIVNDSGVFGIVHNLDKWDKALSDESLKHVVNRTMLGALAKIPDKIGYGLNDDSDIDKKTNNRIAAIMLDPYDGRAYLYSNDDPNYVNNETRSPNEKIPERAVARIGDIPTRIAQLKNDLHFISDPDYRHTDNNFTTSNRFVLDNLDDRTFVYPEIAKDKSGDYIENYRVGLNGEPGYAESDGHNKQNNQPDLGHNPDLGDYGDRFAEAISSYNHNRKYSGNEYKDGYLPGIFRSVEELERVDLVDQVQTPLTSKDTPGGRRRHNYYIFDGRWSPNWFDRKTYKDSYLAQSLNPNNMELSVPDLEPVPYSKIDQVGEETFNAGKLYQWRYNRVDLKYYSKDITINIIESGEQYRVGDILRWTFGDDVFAYEVDIVGANGQIQKGHYVSIEEHVYDQDPSTYGIGIEFSNSTGVGHGAKLAIVAKATIESHATQIKNNLYAYVDITPTVRSDNSTPWSDINEPDSQNGMISIRSTAAGPGYTGINSGRGGPAPTGYSSTTTFYEHGGNATAGVHVHLFKYVINTQNPTWVVRDGIQVFTGRWVDQGPMGIERPCDIKALFLSNYDTNNFNNYYKFMLDSIFDSMNRVPDTVVSNNKNATSRAYLHIDQVDPEPDQRFTETRIDPETSQCVEIDITDKVFYVNAATGVTFLYNTTYKTDPSFGYGMRAPGWFAISGSISR